MILSLTNWTRNFKRSFILKKDIELSSFNKIFYLKIDYIPLWLFCDYLSFAQVLSKMYSEPQRSDSKLYSEPQKLIHQIDSVGHKYGSVLVYDFWTPQAPPSYQFCTWPFIFQQIYYYLFFCYLGLGYVKILSGPSGAARMG